MKHDHALPVFSAIRRSAMRKKRTYRSSRYLRDAPCAAQTLACRLDQPRSSSRAHPRKAVVGRVPRITRIGCVAASPASALSRSSSISGNIRCCLGSGGSQPVRALVRKTPARSSCSSEAARPGVQQQPNLQVADDEGRRQDLEAKDAAHGGLLERHGRQGVARPLLARVRAMRSSTSTR